MTAAASWKNTQKCDFSLPAGFFWRIVTDFQQPLGGTCHWARPRRSVTHFLSLWSAFGPPQLEVGGFLHMEMLVLAGGGGRVKGDGHG